MLALGTPRPDTQQPFNVLRFCEGGFHASNLCAMQATHAHCKHRLSEISGATSACIVSHGWQNQAISRYLSSVPGMPVRLLSNDSAALLLSLPGSLHASRCGYMCPWWDGQTDNF